MDSMESQDFNSLNVMITTEELLDGEYLIASQYNENISEKNNEQCNQNLNNKHDINTSNVEEFFTPLEEIHSQMITSTPNEITNDSSIITSDMSTIGDKISDITQFSAELGNSHTLKNKDDNCVITSSCQTQAKGAESIETELQENNTVKNTQLIGTTTQKMETEEDYELRESSDIFCILALKKVGAIEPQKISEQNAQSNSNILLGEIPKYPPEEKNRDFAVQVDSLPINRKAAPKVVDVSIQTDLSMNLNTPKVHEAIQFPSQPLNLSEPEIKEIDIGIQVDSEFDMSSQELGLNSLDVYVGSENANTSLKNTSSVLKSQNSTHSSFNHENIDSDGESVINDSDTESGNQRVSIVSKTFGCPLKTNSPSRQKEVLCTPTKISLNETPENLFEIEGENVVSIATNLNDLGATTSSTDQSTTWNLPKLDTLNISNRSINESSQNKPKMSNDNIAETSKLSEPSILCVEEANPDVIIISSDSESDVVCCATKNNIGSEKVVHNRTKNPTKRKPSNQLSLASKKISNHVPVANKDDQKPTTSKNSPKKDSNEGKEMHAIKIRCFNCRKHMDYMFLKYRGKSKHIVICEFCGERHFVRYNDDNVICSMQREDQVSKK